MAKKSKTKKRKTTTIQAPFTAKEVKKKVKCEKAKAKLDVSLLDTKHLLGYLNLPDNVSLEKLCINVKDSLSEVELKLKIPTMGKYEFPKNIAYSAIKADDFVIDPDSFVELPPFRPDHLASGPLPSALPKNFRTIKNYFEKFPNARRNYATTIFNPDDRRLFLDSSYPWGTVGLVSTALGSGSGVMIGPRHLLTVSHIVQWNTNNAGWINFTPASFDGTAPFGTASGTRIYYRKKVTGPSLNRDEMQHDYVVVVLNRRIGDITGWMGSKSWSDSWDNEPYWSHVGYPGDLNSGTRPSFQSGIPLDGSFWDRERHTRIFHQGDVWPGQSGGPFFAWWSNGPHAVAVQSAQNSSENTASGGSEMVDLVIRARNEYP